MTDRLAFILAAMLLTALVVDVALVGTAHLVFLGKKFADLIEWLAFWR